MNHIAYESALMRRDDLLRAAAKRRLAAQLIASGGAQPGGRQAPSPRNPRHREGSQGEHGDRPAAQTPTHQVSRSR